MFLVIAERKIRKLVFSTGLIINILLNERDRFRLINKEEERILNSG